MNRIPVYFRPEMTASSRFFAPGTFKPAACVEDWQRRGMPVDVRSFEPASVAHLTLAHDLRYVEGVLACRLPNGFAGRQPEVAASLPFTSGAMLAAAVDALSNGRVACAPVSGFHHAQYDSAAGYCTFNGLIVAARHVQNSGLAKRVGILDLDQHYGDGTDEILRRLKLADIVHLTAGRIDRRAQDAVPFLEALAGEVRSFQGCDLLLYQAGADPHVDDPLGGWMTTAQLARRDRIVFETALAMGLPVAWNLAGGYQRDDAGGIGPVLEIHRATMHECVNAYRST